ncbi:MAG: DoxX family membrane protein [Actinobacteria bacterium]|nr:MAG: DoxX family membrane protein [Actinomycetota bacterium]
MSSPGEDKRAGGLSRRLLAAFFVGAGVNHFVMPGPYEHMVPPRLQDDAKRVVAVSGAAEIVGGLAVLSSRTRRLAGAGLVALLAAIFPANLYMARTPERFRKVPRWALYARLPLQPMMMWWAWRATRR